MTATLPLDLTPDLRTRIARTAREWIGTPFVPHARIKGAGVDCVNLPAAILIEAGVIEFVLTGPYTIDAGRHAPTSLLVRWLRDDGRFEEWPVDEPPDPLSPLLEGDLLCFRFGHGVAHHLGLVASPAGDFVHCLRGHGVIQSTLKDPTYRDLLTHHFRPRWASVPPEVRRMGNGEWGQCHRTSSSRRTLFGLGRPRLRAASK